MCQADVDEDKLLGVPLSRFSNGLKKRVRVRDFHE